MKTTTTCPNTLPNNQAGLQKAGPAADPGGTRYIDMVNARSTTVYDSLVINTGAKFMIVAVKGNQALNRVRVEHQAIYGGEHVALGDSLLVGGIKMTDQGAVATLAWPFRASNGGNGHHSVNPRPLPPPPPRLARRVGTVCRIHPSGKFGEILEDRTGQRYFAHQCQFDSGTRMNAGFRVSFIATAMERGPAALDIKSQY